MNQSNCTTSNTDRVKLLKELSTTNGNLNNNDVFMKNKNDNSEQPWSIECSEFAKNTFNPIRRMMQSLQIDPNPSRPIISLSIGDPTILSDLEKPDIIKNIITENLKDKQNDGYTPSFGTEKSRQAVAKYSSRPPNVVYKPQDIILTHGCSHALDLAITVLANVGQNILIPRPGFSIYKVLANTFGIEERFYNLLPDKDWEVDLEHLESLIDNKTVAIIVNNPSNPCGSVYSREHLVDIINIAKKNRLPIIADEVYGDMVFSNKEFYYLSELTDTVPILSCNALSKRFILPGWRFGWIAIHDPKNFLKDVRLGLADLTTRILGPNSLIQSIVCELFEKTPQSYFDNTMKIVEQNAEIAYEKLSKLPGIIVNKPSGAMYMMLGIDFKSFPNLRDDIDFVEKLINEQFVICIPATSFKWPNYVRIVLTMKKEKIIEACDRISEFVYKHYKKTN